MASPRRAQSKKRRSRVLKMLQLSRAPLSAYDVLAELQRANPKTAPTTVYRILNSLIESGEAHRLESKNAFIACQCNHEQHPSIMTICNQCGQVEERVAPELAQTLSRLTEQFGFAPTRHVIELQGLCGACGVGNNAT